MDLIHGTLRPGVVKEVGEKGLIKAVVPGLFPPDAELDSLPPIYPWFGNHANTFSCPKVDEEVWVLSLANNPLQLHWFRKDYYEENNKDFKMDEEGENVEILVNRNYGSNDEPKWAAIYFSNSDGWMIRKDEDGHINIREDGSIIAYTKYKKRIIDICEDSIALGTEGKAEDSAMLYSKWKEWVEKDLRDNILKNLAKALQNNPYTASAGAALQLLLQTFPMPSIINPVESQHVSITEN
jgi:hypothetical protein